MTTIYLSSTYEDLKDYRGAVFETLRKAGHHVIGMEDYVATHQRPVDECLLDVEQADIYVGLFAFRYGYVPPPHHKNPNGLSITELEFRHAENLNKPCLAFIAKRDVGIPLDFVDAYTGDGDKGNQIERLRQHLLTEKLASEFSQPHKLAALVLAAVTKHVDGKKISASPDAKEPNGPAAITWDIKEKGSPYPGLMNFTREYAPVFFGRDLEVREILDRMHLPEGRFIIVSGDSGVGKSSVVAAGVLPVIEKRGLPGGERCEIIHMLPGKRPQPGSSLMMAGLGAMVTRAGLRPDDVLEDLIRDPGTLVEHVKTILKKGARSHALLLFLDQMEELFTSREIIQSDRFLTALYHASQDKALWVVATIRSDHLHHCHGHPEMLRVLRGPGHYPLGPIEPFMLSDLIAKPAHCAGLSISGNLVRRIVHDTLVKADDATGSDQTNLPLLAFVLDELFKKRANHELSEEVYKHVGGVAGAIAHHADQVEADLHRTRGAETKVLLAKLFESLVIVNAEGLPTRRRPLRSEFPSVMKELIEELVRARLLRTEGEAQHATVSISHEKLFEAWPSLKDYIDTNKKELVDRTLLDTRARKWVNMGKPWFDGLASGREYKDFRRAGMTATPLTKEYLYASRRARWLQTGVIGFMILMVGGAGSWLWKTGLTLEDAMLKAKSKFVSIHVAPEMQPVSAGMFRQGDTQGRGDRTEQPVREVRIKSFAIGKFEVTFEEYDRYAIAMSRPLPGDQGWGRGRRPVINVSWDDAMAYAKWLSQQTGKPYRLPTEAEWEYAARSIAKEKDDIWAGTSDEKELDQYAVYAVNSQYKTASVGENERRKPNALGLYDMSGNVWEWVEDCWHDNYQGEPSGGTAWLEAGGGNCGPRVIRGGAGYDNPENLRASYRLRSDADNRDGYIGFRLAQDLPQ